MRSSNSCELGIPCCILYNRIYETTTDFMCNRISIQQLELVNISQIDISRTWMMGIINIAKHRITKIYPGCVHLTRDSCWCIAVNCLNFHLCVQPILVRYNTHWYFESVFPGIPSELFSLVRQKHLSAIIWSMAWIPKNCQDLRLVPSGYGTAYFPGVRCTVSRYCI